jgi:hypothetical protein
MLEYNAADPPLDQEYIWAKFVRWRPDKQAKACLMVQEQIWSPWREGRLITCERPSRELIGTAAISICRPHSG